MAITFSFKEYPSSQFGKIRRPVAQVFFQNKKDKSWKEITMIIDTGADYSLLPKFLSDTLSVNLAKDCKQIRTQGVGGASTVYFLKQKMTVKIGDMKRSIPLGFIEGNFIPPLLGRQEFFETFRVVFEKFSVRFE